MSFDVTRYEKQNEIKVGSLKFKLRKPKVFSSFDSNVVYHNIVSYYRIKKMVGL